MSLQPQAGSDEQEAATPTERRKAIYQHSSSSVLRDSDPIPEELLILVELGEKDINKDFKKKNLFWTLFSNEALDNTRRGILWCKLLKTDAMK